MKLNNLNTKLILLLIVVVMGGLVIWVWWKDAIAPVDSSNNSPITFVVKRGESVRNIANRLSQQGLIRSPIGFFLTIKLLKIDDQLQAGDFRLAKSMNSETIARELTHGVLDVWVTIVEGWRVDEMATKLAKELDIPEREFLKYTQEGYMFPDTYLIPRTASAAAVASIMRGTFDKKVTNEMREAAKASGLTFEEIITLASIIEREGKTDEDRPMIAGVLLNRLEADWPLQADATLQYTLGYQPLEKTWWKKILTEEDKKIDSPYNTYKYKGLPPGPIANPGLASIRAVIYPQKTDYWYYLHDPEGNVHFAKTVEEHNANISLYLR